MVSVLERPRTVEHYSSKPKPKPEPIMVRGFSLKEIKTGKDDETEIIALGWLDYGAMSLLKVDDYQRKILHAGESKRTKLEKDVADGAHFPSIMLGLRGSDYDEKGENAFLKNECYLIDGLQRVTAMLSHGEKMPDAVPDLQIPCEIRFGTTRDSEKKLFETLNANRTPMSPNVLLRNKREEEGKINIGLTQIYGLSMGDKEFALYQRVSWEQRMTRRELVTALVVVKTVDALHRHVEVKAAARGTAGSDSKGLNRMVNAAERKCEAVGVRTFRANIKEFFDVIDKCWGIQTLEYHAKTTQLRGNFLLALAQLFSSNLNFWDGNLLQVDAVARNTLSRLDIVDPDFTRLAASGTQAMPLLLTRMIVHFNKGKRQNMLRPRHEQNFAVAAE